MSKKNKNRGPAEQQPSRAQAPSVCALPAVATYLSWITHIDEADAQKTVNILAAFNEPKRGKIQFDRCESPAERLFLLAGMLTGDSGISINFAQDDVLEEGELKNELRVGILQSDEEPPRFFVLQQYEVAGYRVDFCISPVKLVIEIDGHEFHERTKEQAASDKKRDRALVGAGFRVIRFTGSEVYADPCGVLEECWNIACTLLASNEAARSKTFAEGVDHGFADGHDKGYLEALEELSTPSPPIPLLPVGPVALLGAAE